MTLAMGNALVDTQFKVIALDVRFKDQMIIAPKNNKTQCFMSL